MKPHRNKRFFDLKAAFCFIVAWNIISIFPFFAFLEGAAAKGSPVRKIKHLVEVSYDPETPNNKIIVSETYNKAGHFTELVVELRYEDAPEKNTTLHSKFLHDSQGRKIKKKIIDESGKLISITTYKYSKKGRLKCEIRTEQDKAVAPTKLIFEYNDDEKKETITRYFGGDFRSKYLKKYDVRGNEVGIFELDEKGLAKNSVTNVFDMDNKRKEATFYRADGSIERIKKFSYDRHGNIGNEDSYSASKKLIETKNFEYKYDAEGNWIYRKTRKYKSENKKLILQSEQIIERTISYF